MSSIRLILVVVLLVGALVAAGGVGVAAADDNGKACPGDNNNQGYANANEKGATNSRAGIGTAFAAIGCSSDSAS